jgi:aminoglycoside N3'-acetyltransferase
VSSAGVTVVSLARDLRALGLTSGSAVLVHSSLRAVGRVEGGADGFVAAVLAVVGPGGTMVAPTFTYRSPRFDPATTPGRTGAVSEALRARDGAVRSRHPFYSVAALGPLAAELCRGHELLPGTALGSPLDRLAEHGGLVVLVGVGHEASTTIHVGEFHAAVSYLDIPFDPTWTCTAEIVTPEGPVLVSYDRFAGCSRAFGVLEPRLRARDAVAEGLVGGARTQVVPGRVVIEETVALLAGDERALLCADPGCYRCSRARQRLGRQRVPS